MPRRTPIAQFEALGELQQPHLLPLLAGHPVLPAVDGDVDMAVDKAHELLSGIEYRADGADRRIKPFGDLAIGALQPARFHQRSVKFVGQPRPIRAQRLNPARQLVLVAIGFAPALGRALQRLKRRHQPPRRGVDIGR